MSFDEFYDGNVRNMRDAAKELEKRPYLLLFNELIQPGKKLSARDCEIFWKAFRDSQKDAFESGKKSAE